ncbi:hypothetical protein ACIOMP_23295 [Pseudomonas protegens]|uniref:hypothetical protein n=1 Tax=Pseudomonas protegens TaxID=380021 RepID=UPI00380CF539
MSQMLRLSFFSVFLIFSGCSVGPYIHPESTNINKGHSNSTCHGRRSAFWYGIVNPGDFSGAVIATVYTTLPGTPEFDPVTRSITGTTDTQLRIEFEVHPYKPEQQWAFGKEAKAIVRQAHVMQKMHAQNPTFISTFSSYIVLRFNNGDQREIFAPQMQTTFEAKKNRPSVISIQLSPGQLDDFSITLPDIFVNTKKIDIPTMHFKSNECRRR